MLHNAKITIHFYQNSQKILQNKTKKVDNLGFVKRRFVKTSYEQVMKL